MDYVLFSGTCSAKWNESCQLAIKRCEATKWEDVNVIDTLAAAYAETANFPEAIRYQKMALEKTDEQSRKGMESRLKLFEMDQACFETPTDSDSIPAADEPGNSSDDGVKHKDGLEQISDDEDTSCTVTLL